MTYSQITDIINQNIKQNGREEITGNILNSVLKLMLDFVQDGYITLNDVLQIIADNESIGIIGSINPSTSTSSLPNGFYFAETSGTYTNANNIVVAEGYYTILEKNDSGWKVASSVKMPEVDLSNLATKAELATVDGIAKSTFGKLIPLNPANINFDVTNNQLIISGTNRLVTPHFVITTAPTATVEMPTSNNVYRIEFNPTLSSYEIKLAHAQIVLSNVIIGVYRRASSKIWVHGIEEYFINGFLFLEDEYDESRGEFFSAAGGVINFNTIDGVVEFPAGRIFHKRTFYSVYATSVAKTDSSNRGKIFYDTVSGELTIVPSNQAGTIPSSKIQVGLYDLNNRVFDISCAVTINGADSAIKGIRGEITNSSTGDAINFDIAKLELTIKATCRVTYADKTFFAREQTIDISSARNTWCRLIFNSVSRDFFLRATSSVVNNEGDIQVGRIFVSNNRSSVKVLDIGDFSINGIEAGNPRSNLTEANYIAVNGITDASYVQPDLSGFEWIATALHSQMYALYDDLVTRFPDYVTRILLGNDTIGNPIYRYDFTPPLFNTGRSSVAKIILTSGHHGYEKAGIYVTYSALKEICERWSEDEHLETLRWGVHFIVVPIVNPYGFDNNTRYNERSVDPERNYTAGWEQGDPDPDSGQYRGVSPLSEPSAQYIDAILKNNTDAIYFCSFHNMQSDTNFIWNSSASEFGINLANRLSSRLTVAWSKRYTWATAGNHLGYSDRTAPFGSSAMLSTYGYGIQGGIFEISRRAGMAGDTTLWGSLVATLGTETFINWLLLNLEYGAQLKNSHIRLLG